MLPREPGQLLGGKYRLTRLLGKGGMGTVWHAHHLTLNAPVALKFIDAERLDGPAQQRFLGEARVAAALRSPHVVQVLDYGVEEQIPYIAMELLEGETLADRLKRQKQLDFTQTRLVVQHVSRAIARAHDAGVIHRDLKPQNIFIVQNDEEEVVKVLDFGIAKSTSTLLGSSAAASTNTGALIGTPHYMSPEQVDHDKAIDVRSDLWSLGVLVYQCLLGELPFSGDTMGSIALAICARPLPVPSQRGTVPAGFDAWFARACARDVEARYRSAREAARDFQALSAPPARSLTPALAVAAPELALAETSGADTATATGLASTTGRVTTEATVPPEPRGRRRAPPLVLLALLGAVGLAALVFAFGTGSARAPATELRALGSAPSPLPTPPNELAGKAAAKQPAVGTAALPPNPPTSEPAPTLASPAEVQSKAELVVQRPAPAAARPAPAPSRAPPSVDVAPAAPQLAPARVPDVPAADIDLGI